MRESSGGFRLAMLDIRSMWMIRSVRKSLLGLMVLPLMYSFIYLWAFWDPTAHVERLRLAVVNEDAGSSRGGGERNLGRELTAKLTADRSTDWRPASRAEAERGVKDLTYAMALYLPADFSERAFSVSGDRPEPTSLRIELNEGANLLNAKIVRSVADSVNERLRKELQANYLGVIFEQVLNGGKGLKEASDGASKLSAASEQAREGAAKLSAGLADSGGGMAKLSEGLGAIASGANELENGLVKLNAMAGIVASGLRDLNGIAADANGMQAASNGGAADPAARLSGARTSLLAAINDLRGELSALSNGLKAVNDAAAGLSNLSGALRPAQARLEDAGDALRQGRALLDGLGGRFPELRLDADYKRLADRLAGAETARADADGGVSDTLGQLDARAASVQGAAGGAAKLAGAIQPRLDELGSRLDALRGDADAVSAALDRQRLSFASVGDRVKDVASGVNGLQTGSTKLMNGLLRLGGGAEALRVGNAKLADGADALRDGLAAIHQGQAQLADKLADAAGVAAQDGKADQRQAVIGDPVRMTETNRHPVPSNGVGFAPYFIALSLWVGSLVLFFVIDVRRVPERPHGPLSYVGSKYLALASVSVCQSLVSVFVLHTGLGIPTVVPPIAMYAYAVAVGLVFTAILFMLIAVLGSDTGRFVAVLILMLQLTSSSGSYPVVLEPGFFRFIHPYLPMTYAVEGLRQLISIGEGTAIVRTAAVLAGFGIAAILLLYAVKRRRIMSEIKLAEGAA
ncbi:putative membrane protein [Paenibacillus sp. UNC496MF]|uniref:YhgE/Pip domain-containing protein n=1 Tax=Paenibacillus sp. UNC496MF TaxID=1502753 RepID=UPI0008E41BA6|nr:YhgE/Pip domain-containing protein [Paenibacillus sp. UNC496MF]SFJ43568.1 putative membrane protein [Paenibacillus sp. UNC496MF]